MFKKPNPILNFKARFSQVSSLLLSVFLLNVLLFINFYIYPLQNHKLREVFNLDFPNNNFLHKILTVVSGPDMVDLTFHNFVSYKENVGKVLENKIKFQTLMQAKLNQNSRTVPYVREQLSFCLKCWH